jgi:DNA repair exonuclease SbcCD ATPase subunit
MSNEPTEKELKLAVRVNKLEDAAVQPALGDGGLFASAVKFLMSRVSRGMMAAALSIFIAFHAWEAFNESQQLRAELQTKRAEAGKMIAEAVALNAMSGNGTVARATLEAELQKTQEQAATAAADAAAQNEVVNGASMRLQTLRAEIAKTQAEADAAKAEADAQTQSIDGMPAAIAQKKAEVETAETDVAKAIEGFKTLVILYSCQDNSLPSLGCR